MSRLGLFGTALTLLLVMLPSSAFCQAAAESALLNGASSSSAVKAGSALGSALNGASKRLAGRLPQGPQVSPREVRPQAQKTEMKNGAGSVPQPGGITVSVQGGVPACAPAAVNSRPNGDKATTELAPANCQSASVKPAPQDKYKSTITVSFPK